MQMSSSRERVLIACEFSGVVRRAFRERGFDAWSCDLLPAEDKDKHHFKGDIFKLLWYRPNWSLLIAHPPCTHLAVSGARHFKNKKKEQLEALCFVQKLLDLPIPHIALENPVSVISTLIRKPNQIIQPYQFGHDASKRTCLWLKNLPLLQSTKYVEPRIVNGKKRWANQTDSGQNKLAPGPSRAKDRGRTYEGIAIAMAEQWGDFIASKG